MYDYLLILHRAGREHGVLIFIGRRSENVSELPYFTYFQLEHRSRNLSLPNMLQVVKCKGCPDVWKGSRQT